MLGSVFLNYLGELTLPFLDGIDSVDMWNKDVVALCKWTFGLCDFSLYGVVIDANIILQVFKWSGKTKNVYNNSVN